MVEIRNLNNVLSAFPSGNIATTIPFANLTLTSTQPAGINFSGSSGNIFKFKIGKAALLFFNLLVNTNGTCGFIDITFPSNVLNIDMTVMAAQGGRNFLNWAQNGNAWWPCTSAIISAQVIEAQASSMPNTWMNGGSPPKFINGIQFLAGQLFVMETT